ncbi:DNA mismatch repair protein MutS [Candidatus Methylacidiphilum fumarolicum]|uniref:DNA mismatch repair protein MutS n=3 Tax=Candidatus Methylacidiphilum fumarolicum TaxID=591154 RepID=I0JVF5_METFB|nr:DNA mismatch repair protein MutS [Candidatus Methylacidiphilum fumarolicum]TFE76545.1 DNA mismatch repair protein MutS [Candidatus Methylacidiphilum fumarolicum]CAI9084551.1 DNA mismatch repair protein MutS [Candidatus Methylacidiphilum fumarolicum]CCG91224.1 DNA mismatch repair protein mutS [Methylacidiphilum fumariolicum SolV]
MEKMKEKENLTPMMRQYWEIKQKLPPDVLLLFRLGDFFELFLDDAKEGARILNLVLTQRQGVPMCGVPVENIEGYVSKLVKAGKRVALCDQMEQPKPGQLVKREIVRILSPGSNGYSSNLDPKEHQFCMSLYRWKKKFGIALMDITTGLFLSGQLENEKEIMELVNRYGPVEVILAEGAECSFIRQNEHGKELIEGISQECYVHRYFPWAFDLEEAKNFLMAHFKVSSLDGYGLREMDAAICAAGALLRYFSEVLHQSISHIVTILQLSNSEVLWLDSIAQKTLEVIQANSKSGKSLFHAIDKTLTPGGGRLLRRWLSEPSRCLPVIQERQQAIALWINQQQKREQLREILKKIGDLERLLSKVSQGYVNPRELLSLKESLQRLPLITELLSSIQDEKLRAMAQDISIEKDMVAELDKALEENPPFSIKEGGIIKKGYCEQLDELRELSEQGQKLLIDFEQQEREKTGIKTLKIKYNQVFGYLIEISHAQAKSVPSYYERRQTLANVERFITRELKEIEQKILGSKNRANELEQELFSKLREKISLRIPVLQKTVDVINKLDVFSSLASLAQEKRYCRPSMVDEPIIEIEEGRHPIVEQCLPSEDFVPNSTFLGPDSRILILTGPNMAGKSTYIRQVALICLLAHTGSFVPAKRAKIGLLDRIFTRIGSSDDLSMGQSTFLVEMNETANILHNATERSLVILDEVGRGTSTFDGLSLAWAIVEDLYKTNKSLTLFATHYHELAKLADFYPEIKNYSMAVVETTENVVFLRKVVQGSMNKSYGIQVAKLAGIPERVIEKAKKILSLMESDKKKKTVPKKLKEESESPSLFPHLFDQKE